MKIFQKLRCSMLMVFCMMCTTVGFATDLYVRPCGQAVGIKMYTDGLLVVGVSDVTDTSGKKIPTARNAGIKTGDIIISANGKALQKTEDLYAVTENADNEISLEIKRKDKPLTLTIDPVPTESGSRLGLWVRDSTAGVGTITYISQDTKSFAALGHGITDVDTGNILSLKSGNILNCSQISANKSKKGDIGELTCNFDGPDIGDVLVNSKCGIFGKTNAVPVSAGKEMRVASANEVHEGSASILCNVDSGGVREYDIEIKKISKAYPDDKALVIEVTDPELLKITGGIVQGMSGSPIIQNDLFVGAVTHVFVNNPTRGYGILGESMVEKKDE